MKRIIAIIIVTALVGVASSPAYARRDPDYPIIIGAATFAVVTVAVLVAVGLFSSDDSKTTPQPQPFMPLTNSPFKRDQSEGRVRSGIACPQGPQTFTVVCW